MINLRSIVKLGLSFLYTTSIMASVGHAGIYDLPYAQSIDVKGKVVDASISPEEEILQKLHIFNLFDMKIGQLALARSSEDRVLDFGIELVSDSLQTYQELRDFAAGKVVLLSSFEGDFVSDSVSLFKDQLEDMYENLKQTTPTQFVETLSAISIKSHQDLAVLVEHAQMKVTDPDVQMLLEQKLRIIAEHIALTQEKLARL